MFILTFASKVIKWKNEYYLAFDGNTLSLTKLKKWQMIDSIKIILRDFSGDLKNCIPKPSRKLIENPGEKEYDNYRLPNRAKSDRHYLNY